jgi:hypothetical protein
MADEENVEKVEAAPKSRRDFVKTSAQVAVTAPAVAVLLSASTKRAFAQSAYQASAQHILDDYTFGNDHEDVDVHRFGTNFNPFNNGPVQDDHI